MQLGGKPPVRGWRWRHVRWRFTRCIASCKPSLDGAFWSAVVLLSLGALTTLLKGFVFHESVALLVVLAALLACRRSFTRKASLLSGDFGSGWTASVGAVLLVTLWLTLFAYKHVEYRSDLWWRFALEAQAPRSLRALVGAACAVLALSLGRFDEAYISRFSAAVVRDAGGRIMAFANMLESGGCEELSVDLMRHSPDAPGGLMDYLFIELMLDGRKRGYRWFNLGMAPLSGLPQHELAPLWNRLGGFLFRHGEHVYNFQGLRRYKEKYQPQWRPRYLASPGGLVLPRVLRDLSALISGGVGGIVGK